MKKFLLYTLLAVATLAFTVVKLRPSETKIDGVDYDKYYQMLADFSTEDRSYNSENHDQMRDYLVEELESRGLEVQLIESQPGEQVVKFDGSPLNIGVSNIYATLPANNPSPDTKNIAFASHYDSVIESPGAADAGLGVIGLFAGLDQIIDQERTNDISILITDHEELGLVGATYIANYRPEIYEEIDFIYNWEARGSSGNVILFETSKNDYQAVKNYNQVVGQKFAASAATAIYENMPNGSDFTVFKNAGIPGLNFAILEDFANYHTSLDTIDNIPAETFNTYINNQVQLIESGATQSFDVEPTNRSIYFEFLDSTIIIKDSFVNMIIAVSIVLYFVILGLMIRKREFTYKHILVSILTIISFYVISQIIMKVPISLFERFAEFKPYQPDSAKIRYTLLYNDVYAIVTYLVLAACVIIIPKLLEMRKLISKSALIIVTMTVLIIIEVLVYNFLYGGLQMLLFPIVIYQLVYLLNHFRKTEWFDILLVVFLIPILYPVGYYIYIALTVNTYSVAFTILLVFTLFFSHITLKKPN